MSRFVPYLADEAIERDAASLIAEYEHARGVTIEPPIPVEDIVEKYLKLRIEFDDMHARHNIPRPPNGQPDILGAIYGDGSIFIDESLDPEENPSREGRLSGAAATRRRYGRRDPRGSADPYRQCDPDDPGADANGRHAAAARHVGGGQRRADLRGRGVSGMKQKNLVS